MDLTFDEEYVPVPKNNCSKFMKPDRRGPENSTSSSEE
jgi:hypothetical protein